MADVNEPRPRYASGTWVRVRQRAPLAHLTDEREVVRQSRDGRQVQVRAPGVRRYWVPVWRVVGLVGSDEQVKGAA